MLYTLNNRHIEFKNRIKKWVKENISDKQYASLSKELLESLKSLKIAGFHSPKPFAGHAKDFLFHVLAIEEISKINPNISLSIITNYLFENDILKYGSKNQIIKYVNPVDKGKAIASVAILDEKNNYELTSINTKAILEGDNYFISGEKFCHSNIENADFILIFALTNLELNKRGLSAFIIEKDYDGVEIIKNNEELLYSQGIIKLNNVKVPKENLVGVENNGEKMIINTLISSHLSLSAHYLGISKKIYNELLENLKKTNNPIYNNTLLSKFTDIASEINSCELQVLSGAEKKSNGLDSTLDSAYSKKFAFNIAKKILNEDLSSKLKSSELKEISKIKDFNLSNIYSSDIEKINELIAELLTKDLDKEEKTSIKYTKKTVERKKIIFNSAFPEQNVDELLKEIHPIIKNSHECELDSDLEHCDLAVSVGLGIGDRENIYTAEKFASKIGAVIACSYPVSSELQWLDKDRLIGTLGKSFYGEAYFALGISGNREHLSGLKDAGTIIAINKDKHAPIFSNCDYGIVGDVNQILPILIEKF